MDNFPGGVFSSEDPAQGHRLRGNVPAQAGDSGRPGPDNDPALLHFSRSERVFWEAQPPRLQFWASFGPQAALIVALFGFAWAASSYFSAGSAPSSTKPPGGPGNMQQEMAERRELTSAVQKMAAEIRSLQSGVETLRAGQSQAAKIGAALSGVNSRLDAVKSETSAAIAAMAQKLERAQHEPEAKLSQVIDRLDHLERKLATPAPAEAPPVAAGTSSKTAQAAYPDRPAIEDGEGARRPHLITNWVVRDVYGGIALLENHRGVTLEVAPGEYIPGAGRVKSIERRGPGWIVITSQGLVDSARDIFIP